MSEVRPSTARGWLRTLAEGIARSINRRDLSVFRTRSRVTINVAPFTEGWFADLGDPDVAGAEQINVFLDKLPGDDEYHIWVGFFVLGADRATHMAKHLQRHVGTPVVLPDSIYGRRGGFTVMKSPLPRARYDRPVLELFEQGPKGLGMYISGRPDFSRRPRRDLIEKGAAFLAESLAALEDWEYRTGPRTSVSEVPIREGVVSRRAFRRNPRQAEEAKRRDKYTCRVCGLKPQRRYGAAGRACLEAHHVRALHTGRERTSKLRQLVTVCANCHRVLGRLPPDERGLARLQARFRRRTA